jgi:hypothetical protein
MPHTKEKHMINTNRAVLVKFPASTNPLELTSSAAADIYVPFKVSQINVKGIYLDFDSDFQNMYFTSNLVDYGPLGSGFGGILCDNSSTTKQLTYLFKDPRDINGSYTFTYHVLDIVTFYFANGYVPGTGPDTSANTGSTPGSPAARVLFMLEFIGYV